MVTSSVLSPPTASSSSTASASASGSLIKADGGLVRPSTIIDSVLDKIELAVPSSSFKTWQLLRSRYAPLLNDIERGYFQSPLALKLHQSTGIAPAFWSVAGGLVAAMAFWQVLKRTTSLAVNIVGATYPVYQSIKAIENQDEKETKQWLSYWTVYTCINFAEHFSDSILSWLPMYYWVKLGALVYCFHPMSRGAETIYNRVLHPLYVKYHVEIDEKIVESEQKFVSAAKNAFNKIESTIEEQQHALDSYH